MPSVYTPDATNPLQPADTDYAYLQASEMRTLKQYIQTQLGVLAGPVNTELLSNRNLIVNPDFYYNRRSAANNSETTLTLVPDNTVLADQWLLKTDTTQNAQKKAFDLSLGEVPGSPKFNYYLQYSNALNATTGYLYLTQRLEDVARFFGQTVTLSFWAKASASTPLSLEFVQNFGTGGTPTAEIDTIGVSAASKKTITTSWAKYSLTVAIPAAPVGLVMGTNQDDYLALNLWFAAGSNYNARTSTIGQPSINTINQFARVQLEFSGAATSFDDKGPRLILDDCARFLPAVQPSGISAYGAAIIGQGNAVTTTTARIFVPFAVRAKKVPTGVTIAGTIGQLNLYNGAGTGIAVTAVSIYAGGVDGCILLVTVAAGLTAGQGTALTSTTVNTGLYFTGCEL